MTQKRAMHNATDTLPKDGSLARKGRAIQTIKDILGLDDEEYRAYRASLTEKEDATFEAELERYITTCSVMRDRYVRWSSQLLMEAPTADHAINLSQSSLIAPMGAALLKGLESNPGVRIPQNVRDAANKIKALASYRQEYFDSLHAQLRPDELVDFGEWLMIVRPPFSAMPDIALLSVLEGAANLWKGYAAELVTPDHDLADTEITEWASTQHQHVTALASRHLQRLLSAPSRQKDSLAARLLLACMVNRTHWELLEFERFAEGSIGSLLRLVAVLRSTGWGRIPIEYCRERFEEWLLGIFSLQSASGDERWRALKPQHPERFRRQAEWTLQCERNDGVEHRENDDQLLNLSVLLMSWNFCSYEKHDMRVPDVKEYDLVNGRRVEDEAQVPLTRIMYHQRQLNTMLRSHQQFVLSESRLRIYHAVNLESRRELMRYIRSNLAGLTLSQWVSLTRSG